MVTLSDALVTLQALGAVIGVGATIIGEIAYVQAMRDGIVDAAEAAHLRPVARGVRFGLTTLLLSSPGLVILAFMQAAEVQPAMQSAYWTEMLLALVIIVSSWALSSRRISFALGSAALFSAWWFLVLLAFGHIPEMSFGASIALYVVATTIFFAFLWQARLLILSRA